MSFIIIFAYLFGLFIVAINNIRFPKRFVFFSNALKIEFESYKIEKEYGIQ